VKGLIIYPLTEPVPLLSSQEDPQGIDYYSYLIPVDSYIYVGISGVNKSHFIIYLSGENTRKIMPSGKGNWVA
jgi:hypothetical protein